MLTIDGSKGEGGGQMLRTSLSLSSILQEPVKITNIRALRPKPGLAAQHLAGVRLVKELTRADLTGDDIGSKEVVFKPTERPAGEYDIDIGTAGSVSLLLQTGLYPALIGHSKVHISATGGTDVKWSPPIDFLSHVFLPSTGLDKLVKVDVKNRGYFPKGGGKVEMDVEPGKAKYIMLQTEGDWNVQGCLHSSGLPDHILIRMEKAVKEVLGKVDLESELGDGLSSGCGLTLWSHSGNAVLGSSAFGERGQPAEKVGNKAAQTIKEEMESGAVADGYLADQLLIPLTQYGGEFTCRFLTKHTRTNIDVIHQFLGDVIKIEKAGKLTKISCEGKSV